MAQVPIIRRKPEEGDKPLLSLVITHPTLTGDPPQVTMNWDKDWVDQNHLPPVFSQQILLMALQTLFAAGLVICGGVMAPPTGVPQN